MSQYKSSQFLLSFCLSLEPSVHIASSVSLIYNTDLNLHNECMWHCGKWIERNTNRSPTWSHEKCSGEGKRNEKKYCTTDRRTIIQLHAIVYAVIYYDFRAAFMEIKCSKWTREPFFFGEIAATVRAWSEREMSGHRATHYTSNKSEINCREYWKRSCNAGNVDNVGGRTELSKFFVFDWERSRRRRSLTDWSSGGDRRVDNWRGTMEIEREICKLKLRRIIIYWKYFISSRKFQFQQRSMKARANEQERESESVEMNGHIIRSTILKCDRAARVLRVACWLASREF